MSPPESQPTLRFGEFEVDLRVGELRNNGNRLTLPGQPFQVLAVLLERPDQLVTRDELRKRLWPADTFVDFEQGLNKAVNRLREALGDSAERPRYIETLPRRGYRFIATVEPVIGDLRKGVEPRSVEGSRKEEREGLQFVVVGSRSRQLWIAAVLALVLVLGGIFFWLSRPFPPPRLLNTVQITHDRVPKTSVLTDGSRLYITESLGTKQILVQASVTGGETSVIPVPFANIAVSDISPDHSRLLAADALGTDIEVPLWALPLAAGAPRRLGDTAGHSGVWSPDGRQLAFAKGSEIYVANADGSNLRILTTVSGLADSIRFSPDGTRLRFTLLTTPTSSSIWEVRADGNGLHPVLPGWHTQSSQCCGMWSPDGRYYYFVSGSINESVSLWALRQPSGLFHRKPLAPVQLTTGPMFFGPVVPSPDGKRLFADGWLPRGELVRYDCKSRQFGRFLSEISPGDLDFSRDGQWVAYVSYPEGTLWRSRIDGSERLQLTSTPVFPFLPRWSPDGTKIAYIDKQERQQFKIFLISGEGGTPQAMLSEQQQQSDASWSPDGKLLVFGRVPWLRRGAEKITIQVLDLASKQVSTVPGSENLFAPRWSPDGQHLAALSADSKRLLLFDFKTRRWTDWVNGAGAISFPTWARDGQYIYYDNLSKETVGYRRTKVGQTQSELVVDLKDLHRFGPWSGLDPDGSPLFIRDVSADDIYSLDLELP